MRANQVFTIIIIIVYLENVHFFHAKLGLDVCLISSPSTYLWILPIQAADQAISCHSLHTLPKFSCPYPHISHLSPPYLCKMTPNHPHSYDQDVQTISICHALPHQPHTEYPEVCTNPHYAFYPSRILHTFISTSFCPLDFLDSQPSLLRSQSYMS